MTIHRVGETIDAKRAHQRAQAGERIQPVRGVDLEHDADAEARSWATRSPLPTTEGDQSGVVGRRYP